MKSYFTPRVLASTINLSYESARDIAQTSENVKAKINEQLYKANRRLRSLKSSKWISPALKSLVAERGDKGFSIARLNLANEADWTIAKNEYGRAIAFMQNPTSVLTGARQYVKNIADRYTKGDVIKANILVDKATEPTINETGVVSVFQYGSIIEKASADVEDAIFQDDMTAEEYAEKLEEQIRKATERIMREQERSSSFFSSFFSFSSSSPRMR